MFSKAISSIALSCALALAAGCQPGGGDAVNGASGPVASNPPTPTPPAPTPPAPTPPVPPPTGSTTQRQIGAWSERILNADGSINQTEYRAVAAAYNTEEMLQYRLGPTAADFGNATNTAAQLWGPDQRSGFGLWSYGTLPTNNPGEPEKCVDSSRLPGSDQEARARGMEGPAWLTGGAFAYLPDDPSNSQFRLGVGNIKGVDGLVFEPSGGLCMRMYAQWYGDWWTRNSIGQANQPQIAGLANSRPDLPLVPVAIARSRTNAGQISFAAFRDGTIAPMVIGNSAPEFFDSSALRLPAGMVPTALAVTPYNEFLVVSVWDTNTVTGKLAFIALRPRQMAMGSPSQTPNTRWYWGLPGAWTNRGMKLLGFVDLPFAAPSSLDVSNHVVLGNPRGYGDNDNPSGDLSIQASRDTWYNVPAENVPGALDWKQNARAGYAIVASRAENKVAFVDMAPLYQFYRTLYMTTQANYNLTTNASLTDGARFPFSFAARPEQTPVVATTLTVQQPTAVNAGIFAKHGTGVPRAYDLNEASRRAGGGNIYPDGLGQRQAYVATMTGDVLFFDVSRINLPSANRTVPETPLRTVKVGRNPSFLYTNSTSTKNDDLFLVSRGDRSVTYVYPDGQIVGTLRDSRLVDPVGGAVSYNQAGFGGRGAGIAVNAATITIVDYNGKIIHTYAVDGTFAASWARPNAEQYPFTTPNGLSRFLWGSSRLFPGKPFMVDLEEII